MAFISRRDIAKYRRACARRDRPVPEVNVQFNPDNPAPYFEDVARYYFATARNRYLVGEQPPMFGTRISVAEEVWAHFGGKEEQMQEMLNAAFQTFTEGGVEAGVRVEQDHRGDYFFITLYMQFPR